MLGPRIVADAVAGHLAALVGGTLDVLEAEHGPVLLDPDSPAAGPTGDPAPKLVASTQLSVDGVGVDDWPFLLVVMQRMRKIARVDVDDDGSVLYRCEYPGRVFVWVRGDGFHGVAGLRDRLTLAVRQSLLANQRFGVPAGPMSLLEDELKEAYSDVGVDEELHATVGAAFVEIVVVTHERMAPGTPPAGVAGTVEVDTRTLPAHPALS